LGFAGTFYVSQWLHLKFIVVRNGRPAKSAREHRFDDMIRKLKSGQYRLYSRKKDTRARDAAEIWARSGHVQKRKSMSARCSISSGPDDEAATVIYHAPLSSA
jgi:hypothetical protein